MPTDHIAQRLRELAAWHDPQRLGVPRLPMNAHSLCRDAADKLLRQEADLAMDHTARPQRRWSAVRKQVAVAVVSEAVLAVTRGGVARPIEPAEDTPEGRRRFAALESGQPLFAAAPEKLSDERIAEVVSQYVLPQQAAAFARALERIIRGEVA